jgi:hypothetical protein
MQLRALIVLSVAVLAACSDSNGNDDDDDTRPMDELGILRLGDDSPPLFNPVQSFYAKLGEDRVLQIFFEDEVNPNLPGDEYLRLEVDADAPLAYPDGTEFAAEDSVLITVRVVDPDRLLFDFQPAGLTFSPATPARLKIHYDKADGDLDEDGDVDPIDGDLELVIDLWRQERVGEVFERLGTIPADDIDEIDGEVNVFSRYAVAW